MANNINKPPTNTQGVTPTAPPPPPYNNANKPAANKVASNNTTPKNKAKNNNKANNKKNNNSGDLKPTGEYDIVDALGKKYLSQQTTRIVFMSLIAIGIFFGLVTLLYHYATARKVQTLHKKTIALFNKESLLIPASNLKPSFNNKQTYLVYINFENSSGNHIWYKSFQENKIILRRIDDNFMLKYNPKSNKLVVDIRIKKLDVQQVTMDNIYGIKDENATSSDLELGLHSTYEHIYVPNVPHHKWIQVAVVIDNRLVDIYFNGKLATSRVIQNVPIISNESLLLGQEYHNPNAYVGRVEYTNDVLSPLDLKTLYNKNKRFLKIDPVLRNIVLHDAYNLHRSPSTTE